MTSPSDEKPSNSPHGRLVQIVVEFNELTVDMAKDLEGEERNVSPDGLHKLLNLTGELIWCAGSMEVYNSLVAAEQGGLIKVVH